MKFTSQAALDYFKPELMLSDTPDMEDKYAAAAESLVYSYDLVSKALRVLPEAANTGYVGYVSHMIEGDLVVLNKVLTGQSDDMGTMFQKRDIEKGCHANVVTPNPLGI